MSIFYPRSAVADKICSAKYMAENALMEQLAPYYVDKIIQKLKYMHKYKHGNHIT